MHLGLDTTLVCDDGTEVRLADVVIDPRTRHVTHVVVHPVRGGSPHRLAPLRRSSTMPLAWAHAELAKLATFARRGRPVEQLDAVRERYRVADPPRGTWHWRIDAPFTAVPAGRRVVVDGTAMPSTPTAWRHLVPIEPRRGTVHFELHADDHDPVEGTVTWGDAPTAAGTSGSS